MCTCEVCEHFVLHCLTSEAIPGSLPEIPGQSLFLTSHDFHCFCHSIVATAHYTLQWEFYIDYQAVNLLEALKCSPTFDESKFLRCLHSDLELDKLNLSTLFHLQTKLHKDANMVDQVVVCCSPWMLYCIVRSSKCNCNAILKLTNYHIIFNNSNLYNNRGWSKSSPTRGIVTVARNRRLRCLWVAATICVLYAIFYTLRVPCAAAIHWYSERRVRRYNFKLDVFWELIVGS